MYSRLIRFANISKINYDLRHPLFSCTFHDYASSGFHLLNACMLFPEAVYEIKINEFYKAP
jgi:hypothetical protein